MKTQYSFAFLLSVLCVMAICTRETFAVQRWEFPGADLGSIVKDGTKIIVEIRGIDNKTLNRHSSTKPQSGNRLLVFIDAGDADGPEYRLSIYRDYWELTKIVGGVDSEEGAGGMTENIDADAGKGFLVVFDIEQIEGRIKRCWLVRLGTDSNDAAATITPGGETAQGKAEPGEEEEEEGLDEPAEQSTIYSDRTENILATYRLAWGLRELKEVKNGHVTMKLYITKQAEALIENHTFDVADDHFDLSAFSNELAEIFLDSVAYFSQVVPENPLREFHVIIEDLEQKRFITSASARRFTRIIRIDLRRWHKMYRGRRPEQAWGHSIHEFTHIVNYELDARETKYHLELTAVLFEAMNYVRNFGLEKFKSNYLEAAILKSRTELMSSTHIGNAPLRHIAFHLICSTLDGKYSSDASLRTLEERSKIIERFAACYIANSKTGDDGFNDSLRQIGIKDKSGELLTIAKIRQTMHDQLAR